MGFTQLKSHTHTDTHTYTHTHTHTQHTHTHTRPQKRKRPVNMFNENTFLVEFFKMGFTQLKSWRKKGVSTLPAKAKFNPSDQVETHHNPKTMFHTKLLFTNLEIMTARRHYD